MVCDKKAIHYYNYRYFTAIDKSDPQGNNVCGGDSGGIYTKVLDDPFSMSN